MLCTIFSNQKGTGSLNQTQRRRWLQFYCVLLFFPSLTVGAPPTVPAEFQELYSELDTKLSEAINKLKAAKRETPTRRPLRAAALLTVNSHVGKQMLTAEWRSVHELYLDRLQELGCEVIVFEVSYPLLTPGFQDPAPYYEFYKTLAESVRRRNLKLMIKHNTLLPEYTQLPVRAYYQQLDKSRFGKERYMEAAQLVQRLQPDYFSLLGEPGTHESCVQLGLTIREWVGYAALAAARLRQDLPGTKTLLGAGAGTWESPLYVEGYGRIKELDYMDIHVYPLGTRWVDYLGRIEEWSRRLRELDQSKKILIGEAWLYKASSRELTSIATNKAIFSRDVYSFWEPLDQKFLEFLKRTATSEQMELYEPFWSRYFFAYVDYDLKLSQLPPDRRMQTANLAALQALQEKRVTKAGKTFSETN